MVTLPSAPNEYSRLPFGPKRATANRSPCRRSLVSGGVPRGEDPSRESIATELANQSPPKSVVPSAGAEGHGSRPPSSLVAASAKSPASESCIGSSRRRRSGPCESMATQVARARVPNPVTASPSPETRVEGCRPGCSGQPRNSEPDAPATAAMRPWESIPTEVTPSVPPKSAHLARGAERGIEAAARLIPGKREVHAGRGGSSLRRDDPSWGSIATELAWASSRSSSPSCRCGKTRCRAGHSAGSGRARRGRDRRCRAATTRPWESITTPWASPKSPKAVVTLPSPPTRGRGRRSPRERGGCAEAGEQGSRDAHPARRTETVHDHMVARVEADDNHPWGFRLHLRARPSTGARLARTRGGHGAAGILGLAMPPLLVEAPRGR